MELVTLSEIAAESGVPRHAVDHLVRTQGFQPSARVGISRVYTREDASRIIQALADRAGARHVGRADILATLQAAADNGSKIAAAALARMKAAG